MSKKLLLLLFIPVFLFLALSAFSSIFAQDTEHIVNIFPDTNFQPITQLRPSNYVSTAINILLGAAGVVSLIFLVWGGIQWIMAGADKDALEKARKRIMNALIGLIIVFSVYALLFIIRALFNINFIRLDLQPILTSTSGNNGGGGGGGGGSVNGNCVCFNGLGCAHDNDIALGNDGNCWVCGPAPAGWTSSGGPCNNAITCSTCP